MGTGETEYTDESAKCSVRTRQGLLLKDSVIGKRSHVTLCTDCTKDMTFLQVWEITWRSMIPMRWYWNVHSRGMLNLIIHTVSQNNPCLFIFENECTVCSPLTSVVSSMEYLLNFSMFHKTKLYISTIIRKYI